MRFPCLLLFWLFHLHFLIVGIFVLKTDANGEAPYVIDVQCGNYFTCALTSTSRIKCFGENSYGQLGLGDTRNRGVNKNQLGSYLPYVELGSGTRLATSIALGAFHVCVIISSNLRLKCFGYNGEGELGYGDTSHRGDNKDEMSDSLPLVDLGISSRSLPFTVKKVSTRWLFTCVLLDNNQIKCFGSNEYGQLGYGDDNHRGDNINEMGNSLPFVNLGTGRTVSDVICGSYHSCVILDNKKIKCWGDNRYGQLGIGTTATNFGSKPGDMGNNLPEIQLGNGRTVKKIALGEDYSCAILDNDQLKCWGYNSYGQLGQGDKKDRGNSLLDLGDNLPKIDLGKNLYPQSPALLSSGNRHTCIVLSNSRLKCWGNNRFGQLGLGDTKARGDNMNEMGDDLPFTTLLSNVTILKISSGGYHSCALLISNKFKCWGENDSGQLGIGDDKHRGDRPSEMGMNLPFSNILTLSCNQMKSKSSCSKRSDCSWKKNLCIALN